jgi:hypothetical protein
MTVGPVDFPPAEKFLGVRSSSVTAAGGATWQIPRGPEGFSDWGTAACRRVAPGLRPAAARGASGFPPPQNGTHRGVVAAWGPTIPVVAVAANSRTAAESLFHLLVPLLWGAVGHRVWWEPRSLLPGPVVPGNPSVERLPPTCWYSRHRCRSGWLRPPGEAYEYSPVFPSPRANGPAPVGVAVYPAVAVACRY